MGVVNIIRGQAFNGQVGGSGEGGRRIMCTGGRFETLKSHISLEKA